MKKTLLALMVLAGGASALTITEDTTMTPGGNFYAGAFDFTFTLNETLPTEDTYLLGYYANTSASGDYSGNVFTLKSTDAGLTLSLDRVASLTITDGVITAVGSVHNSSIFKAEGSTTAYTLGAGTYRVNYLGGGNGSAAADLYLGDVKVASFTGGSHNMNGGDATTTLNVKASSSYVIPEPTTATLSLLALAGLAARRRRASR